MATHKKKTAAKKAPVKKAPAKKTAAKKAPAKKPAPAKKAAPPKSEKKAPDATPDASVKKAVTPAPDGPLKPAPDYGISRIDQEKGTHGWFVRTPTGPEGATERQFFSDSKHGGLAGALAAARAYRDEKFKELPLRLQERATRVRKKSTRKQEA